jgi:predicted CoA-binding protein
MVTLQGINDFLSVKELAIAGVSRNSKKFGFMVFQELKKRGYNLYPINPNTDTFDNCRCFKSVLELPSTVSNLYIVTSKENTAQIIRDAVIKGIQNIWIQQKSETLEALTIAREHGIKLIQGECIIMFISPSESFHKFHRFLRRLFGGMPR